MSPVCLLPFLLVSLCSTMETPGKIKKRWGPGLNPPCGTHHHWKKTSSSATGGCGVWGVWEPSEVECRRRGWDDRGQDLWRCEAYKLHNINVTCEGLYLDEDDFILPGSCGLQYSSVFFLASLEFWGEVFAIIPLVIGVIIIYYIYLIPSNMI